MKYKSELINEIIETSGHVKSTLHYQSECIETWIEEIRGAYPKLTDYDGEWLNYYLENTGIGEFPYLALTNITSATVDNCVPINIKSAILKGSTKYRDIDTGEFLEAFEEDRNLELVSVQMPVLKATGKNLLDPNTVELVVEGGSNSAQTVTYDSVTDTYEFLCPNSGNQMKITLKNLYKVTNAEQVYVSGTYESEGKVYNMGSRFTPNNDKLSLSIVHNWRPVIKANLKIMITRDKSAITAAYEPFKSNILSTSEEVVLRGIGGVHDELDCLTGKVAERIGEIVLDGSENWKINDAAVNNNVITFLGRMISDAKVIAGNVNYTSDKIPSLSNNFWNSDAVEGFMFMNNKQPVIKIKRETASTSEELVTYLSQNPITVQYQLATESVKTVDVSITNQGGDALNNLNAIEGTMHIETESKTIKPLLDIEVPVEAITQNLNSFIEG